MAPNFASILDKAASDVERPKPLPVGTYTCVVKGLPKYDESSQKKTPYVEFTLQPLAAGDDVDAEALDEMLTRKDGTKKMLGDMSLRATYYLTDDAMWRLKKFLEDLGLDVEDKSFQQMIDEAPGNQVLATVKHQASNDGEAVFAQLSGTAKVD